MLAISNISSEIFTPPAPLGYKYHDHIGRKMSMERADGRRDE